MTPSKSRLRLSLSSRGILIIASGTAGGLLVALAAAPVLTRIYSPADLGTFTVVFALVTTMATVAAGRFELAVPIPREEGDAQSVVILGVAAAASSAVIGTAAVALLGTSIASVFNQPRLEFWLWFVPVTAAVTSIYLLLNQLAIRHRRYGSISRRNLLQAVSMAVAQIGTGAAGLRPGGLVLGLVFAQAAGATSMLIGAGLTLRVVRVAARRKQLRRVLVRFRRFPLLLAPSGLINVLGLQVPVLVISVAYGPEVTGWLGLSQRVLSIPVALLGVAVAQVYVGELAAAARDDPSRVAGLFLRTSRRLALIGAVIAVSVALLGPWAFTLIFGAEWEPSGLFARALAVGLAAQLLAAPLSQTLTVLERIGLQLAWDIGRLVVTGGAVTICVVVGGSSTSAVVTFGVASALAYAVLWFLAWRTVTRPAPAAMP